MCTPPTRWGPRDGPSGGKPKGHEQQMFEINNTIYHGFGGSGNNFFKLIQNWDFSFSCNSLLGLGMLVSGRVLASLRP